jgi:Acyl-CoA dehydrogenase, C-terminal domain
MTWHVAMRLAVKVAQSAFSQGQRLIPEVSKTGSSQHKLTGHRYLQPGSQRACSRSCKPVGVCTQVVESHRAGGQCWRQQTRWTKWATRLPATRSLPPRCVSCRLLPASCDHDVWTAHCPCMQQACQGMRHLHPARCGQVTGRLLSCCWCGMIPQVLAPSVVLAILDAAIQVHGGAGVSGDTPLAQLYAEARTLRLADGPDDVHLASLGRDELKFVVHSKL